jgi:hypothetical protein
MMSDPDFLSRTVDDFKRFASKQDSDSYRYQTRLLEKKKKFWGEIIHLQLKQNPNEEAASNTSWKIPRFRLNKEMLEDACNRASVANSKASEAAAGRQSSRLALSTGDEGTRTTTPLMLSHLHHQQTNTVILPDQMQAQCKPSILYDVIVRSAGSISCGGVLSGGTGTRRKQIEQQFGNNDSFQVHYDGNLCFLFHNVPTRSQNKQYVVTKDDVRRWIVDGAIKDHHSMTIPSKRLEDLKKASEKLERELRGLVAMESQTDLVEQEIMRMKKDIRDAEEDIIAARAMHFADCSLSICSLPNKGKDETRTSWKVSVVGTKNEYYQRLIEKNTKWCLISMYATGNPEEADNKKAKSKSENKPNANDLAMIAKGRHFCDVGGIKIEKLPDGFGVYESFVDNSLNTNDEGDADGQHRLYYGHFKEGSFFGEGTLYTEEGKYSGSFQNDERVGRGKMEYSDMVLTGDFALSGNVDDTKSANGTNPYSRGLPHGNVHVIFSNGDEYEGQMHNGNITGKGVYRYARET